MKKDDPFELFDISIEVERVISEIYVHFGNQFPKASSFWWQLAMEETDHASILETARKFAQEELLSKKISSSSLSAINNCLDFVKGARDRIKAEGVSLKEACTLALSLEKSLAESHYQKVMNKETVSRTLSILQRLNCDNLAHYERIRSFMKNLPS